MLEKTFPNTNEPQQRHTTRLTTRKAPTAARLLFKAVEEEQVDVVDFLVQNGTNVNVKNKDGETPLYYAMRVGNVNIAQLLIFAGADINVKNRNGNALLHFARNVQAIRFLIINGADVNIQDSNGQTPLHWIATCRDDVTIVQYLVTHGADIYAKDNYDETPLDKAEDENNTAVAEYLSNAMGLWRY